MLLLVSINSDKTEKSTPRDRCIFMIVRAICCQIDVVVFCAKTRTRANFWDEDGGVPLSVWTMPDKRCATWKLILPMLKRQHVYSVSVLLVISEKTMSVVLQTSFHSSPWIPPLWAGELWPGSWVGMIAVRERKRYKDTKWSKSDVQVQTTVFPSVQGQSFFLNDGCGWVRTLKLLALWGKWAAK